MNINIKNISNKKLEDNAEIDNGVITRYKDRVKKWEELNKNKYYKIAKLYLNFNHMNGIHIDFYHRPYEYIKKKNSEIYFRNKLLKYIYKLNKLMMMNIYLSEYVIDIMIRQCKFIINNKEYWVRFGFTEREKNYIINTYIYLLNTLIEYWTYIPKNVLGMSKNIEGKKLYKYFLKYHTGMDNINGYDLQKYAFLRLFDLLDKLKTNYNININIEKNSNKIKEILLNKSLIDEINKLKSYYINKTKIYDNENKILSNAKLIFLNLFNKIKKYFPDDLLFNPNKILIRSMPYLKSFYGQQYRTYNDILFINTKHLLTHDELLRACMECIILNLKKRKKDKKLYKLIGKKLNKKFNCEREAIISYMTNKINENEIIINNLFLLLEKILKIIRIIIDVSLNSDKPFVHFEFNEIIKLINVFSLYTSEEQIKGEILRLLAKPGYYTNEIILYMLEKKYNNINELFNDYF